METSEKSQDQNLSRLISSVEGSPARISARPESVPELKALAALCGLSTPALLGRLDPDGLSLRTSQVCLIDGQCQEWLESWPDSGMWDSGGVYELQTSAPTTSGNGCSLWPTATANDDNKTPEAHLRMKQRMGERDGTHANRTAITSLSVKVQTDWATPASSWHDRGELTPEQWDARQGKRSTPFAEPLHIQAGRWPTARQEDGESCGNHPGAMDSLTGATKLWPTANAHDATGARGKNNVFADHHYYPHDLAMAIEKWPTPTEDNGNNQGGPSRTKGMLTGGYQDLTVMANHWKTPHGMGNEDFRGKKGGAGGGEFALQCNNWQTPATDSFRSRGGDRKDEMGLDQQARFWPTAKERDHRSAEGGAGMKRDSPDLNVVAVHDFPPSRPAPATHDGPQSSENGPTSRRRLNPRFVEWLMGFPVTWSEL